MSRLDADPVEPAASSPAAIDLEQRFRSSPYWSLRQLVCIREQDCVVVRGTVPTYYLRQIADSLATSVVGHGRLLSEIRVESD